MPEHSLALPYLGLRCLSHLAAVFFLAALALGCGSEADRVVVDFDKTVPAARPGEQASRNPPLRVAVAAMISPKETFDLYRQLLEYLSRQTGKDLEFVQRKTYGEINELLRRGDIDLAFICSGPFATARGIFGFEPLAVPLVHGRHYYQSFLIVNKESPFKNLEDLRGHTFEYLCESGKALEVVRPPLFIADPQQLKMKGLGVAHGRTPLAPRRIGGAVGELDQVQRVLNVLIQLLQGRQLSGIELAGHPAVEDWYRLRPDVFAKLKELEETEGERLVVVRSGAVFKPSFQRLMMSLRVSGAPMVVFH